jgi:predicted phage-related endonuclease
MDQEQPDTKRLIEITREIKALQEQEKQIKERIKTAMEKGGEKEIKIDAVKIVYVAETVIKGIDTKTLALEMPDIAAKYAKETKKSAYIKVTEGK